MRPGFLPRCDPTACKIVVRRTFLLPEEKAKCLASVVSVSAGSLSYTVELVGVIECRKKLLLIRFFGMPLKTCCLALMPLGESVSIRTSTHSTLIRRDESAYAGDISPEYSWGYATSTTSKNRAPKGISIRAAAIIQLDIT